MLRTSLLLILAFTCVQFAGCDSRPKRVPIAGTVLIDGQPLKRGSLRVIPANGRAASAQIATDGTFQFFTFDPDDGVIVGEHPLEVVSTEPVGSGIRWLIPKKYSQIETSGLVLKAEKADLNRRIELTWDGGQPFVERADTEGDAPPVGAVPAEGPDNPSATAP
jgi:hypothetical protein